MLDFLIKDFNLSHGFKAKNGLIIGHIGSLLMLTFFVWPFLLCVVPWVIFSCLGEVWVLDFFVISICTELLCFGRGIGITCSLINCFWDIWVALKRAWQVKDPP